MTLEEKLNNIAHPKLESFEVSNSLTIKEFYTDFIEPRLPQNIDNVIEWHKVLKDYVKMPDAVFGLRTGNSAGHLRRGWETITTDGYSFFYTDNFMPHFFFKLAFDGDYNPNLKEFYDSMKNKTFPVRINFRMGTKKDLHEKEYASFNVHGKNPGLGIAGYKLAHIIDSSQNYFFNGHPIDMSEICKEYFDLGNENDWKEISRGYYSRVNFDIPPAKKSDARKLVEACFLRMVHPMNYFLAPKKPNTPPGASYPNVYHYYFEGTTEKYDIGEYKLLIAYVKDRMHERYTKNGIDYFQEFLDLIYVSPQTLVEDGSTIINVTYSPEPLTKNISSKAVKTKVKQKNTGSNSSTKKSNLSSLEESIIIYAYLFEGLGLRKIETTKLHKDNLGWVAKDILNRNNISTEKNSSFKGMFKNHTISEAISIESQKPAGLSTILNQLKMDLPNN